MPRSTRRTELLTALAGISVVGLLAWAQPGRTGEPNPADTPAKQPAAAGGIGGILVEGLKNSPGCLGVELGQFQSGKNSIFAWFEDKKAVEAWYYNPVHKGVMQAMGPINRKPLQHVPDDAGPILVIATITPSSEQKIPGFPMPISQISIELFQPLPGGAHVNGRLSPATFEVPHMRDLSETE